MPQLVVRIMVLLLATVATSAQFTDWSAPTKVPGLVNTAASETCVAVSKNGLSLYFARFSAVSGYDLYVSRRTTVEDPWEFPVLVPNVNSSANEFCPALSLDEHQLYFASSRHGGCGDGFTDVYVSRRHDRKDDIGWQIPEKLDCESNGGVNSPRGDQSPTFFEDDTGTLVMYFASNRVISQGWDIYQSRMRNDGTFGPATPVAELNTAPFNEIGTAIRRDGLEIIVDSTRPLGLGGRDLWAATRESTTAPWPNLTNLGILNSPGTDGGRLSMSFDGRSLYFTSDRDGVSTDIYVTTRERLHGKKE